MTNIINQSARTFSSGPNSLACDSIRVGVMPRSESGFSLVEACVVMSVIMLTVVMAVPIYSSAMDVAEETTAIEDIKTIANAVDTFAMNNGGLPKTLSEVGMNHLTDPWGNPYIYKQVDTAAAETAADTATPKDGVEPSYWDLAREAEEERVEEVSGGDANYMVDGDGVVHIDIDGDGEYDWKEPQMTQQLLEKLMGFRVKVDASGGPVNTDYDLYSMGPDGDSADDLTKELCRDDIMRAHNGEKIEKVEKIR